MGPLEAMRLEPGDPAALEGLAGDWRVERVVLDEAPVAAPAPSGALVVVLDGLSRVELAAGERGLPRLWLAGPSGGPAGGPGVAAIEATVTGLHGRPWAPAHLKVRSTVEGGLSVAWIPRARLDGDRWDGPDPLGDATRFRVRLLAGAVERDALEVEAEAAVLGADLLAEAFPDGVAEASAAVSQWGEGFGWGVEAVVPLA